MSTVEHFHRKRAESLFARYRQARHPAERRHLRRAYLRALERSRQAARRQRLAEAA